MKPFINRYIDRLNEKTAQRLLEENQRAATKELDLALYGCHIIKTDEDGNTMRINPTDFYNV